MLVLRGKYDLWCFAEGLVVCTIPHDIAARIPEAIARVEADERKIISVCQAPGFTAEKLKALYKEIRPGTY
jgi:hypothetical protein